MGALAIAGTFAVLGYFGDRCDIFGKRWVWLEGHAATNLKESK